MVYSHYMCADCGGPVRNGLCCAWCGSRHLESKTKEQNNEDN